MGIDDALRSKAMKDWTEEATKQEKEAAVRYLYSHNGIDLVTVLGLEEQWADYVK